MNLCPTRDTKRPWAPHLTGALGVLLVATAPLTSCDALTTELERNPDTLPRERIIDVRRTRTDALPADGASVERIRAVLPLRASKRLITFTTTAGAFAHTGGTRRIELRAEHVEDANGQRLEAQVDLVADTIPGPVTVRGRVGEFSDTVVVPLRSP